MMQKTLYDYFINPIYDESVPRTAYKYFDVTPTQNNNSAPLQTPVEGNKTHKYYHKCRGDPYCYNSCKGITNAKCSAAHPDIMYDPEIGDFSRYIDGKSLLEHDCATIGTNSGMSNNSYNVTINKNVNCISSGAYPIKLADMQVIADKYKLDLTKQFLQYADELCGVFKTFLDEINAAYDDINNYYIIPGTFSTRSQYYSSGYYSGTSVHDANYKYGDYNTAWNNFWAYCVTFYDSANTKINALIKKYNDLKTRITDANAQILLAQNDPTKPTVTRETALDILYDARTLLSNPTKITKTYILPYTPNLWVGSTQQDLVDFIIGNTDTYSIDDNIRTLRGIQFSHDYIKTQLAVIYKYALSYNTPTDALMTKLYTVKNYFGTNNNFLVDNKKIPTDVVSKTLPPILPQIDAAFIKVYNGMQLYNNI